MDRETSLNDSVARDWLREKVLILTTEREKLKSALAELQMKLALVERRLLAAEELHAEFEPRASNGQVAVTTRAPAALGDQTLADQSIPDAAEVVLREAGRMMHGKDILRELERRGRPIGSKSPMSSLISAFLRYPRRFKKLGRNRWRLHQSSPAEDKEE